MLELVPLTDGIGTEVRGIDVTGDLSDRDFERILRAWTDTTILLFRGQRMTPEQHIAFTRRFGEVYTYTRSQFNHADHPEILILSNITRDGKPIGSAYSGRVWHSDGHYLANPPIGSMLYALETPPTGGDTWFGNMIAAYEALPARVQERIEDLKVIISRVQSRPYNYPDRPAPTAQEIAEWPDVAQPLVRVHEVSGRKALYAGGNVPWRIEGMPPEESAPLITFLQEFAVQPRFTYRHRWQPGDIILWDNRSAMHRATYYDHVAHRRLMHRTTLSAPQPATAGPTAGAARS
ncbi:TauD/TfdA family dioxygenase [Streptomyces sp. RS10V-4]|uniref:TauD/TfdA dioxygenase family protein n=1 Tax=Streptomyces rhizoryzae TaxID=2932493 RepID=UPI0020059DAE|nr:TauD/TfdA family dioxygenase [Streptomyces rhizoryzae]MCK7624978.1 TauD/TfdA family dioxygenase [Streptomyces rhizoryzae]